MATYIEATEANEEILRARASALLIPFASNDERRRARRFLWIGAVAIPYLVYSLYVNRGSAPSLAASVILTGLFILLAWVAVHTFRTLSAQSVSMTEVGISHVNSGGKAELVRWGDVMGYEFYEQSPTMRIYKRGRGPIELVRHPNFGVPSLVTFEKIADALDARMLPSAMRRRSPSSRPQDPEVEEWEWEELPTMDIPRPHGPWG